MLVTTSWHELIHVLLTIHLGGDVMITSTSHYYLMRDDNGTYSVWGVIQAWNDDEYYGGIPDDIARVKLHSDLDHEYACTLRNAYLQAHAQQAAKAVEFSVDLMTCGPEFDPAGEAIPADLRGTPLPVY